jgi:hypothetical protein
MMLVNGSTSIKYCSLTTKLQTHLVSVSFHFCFHVGHSSNNADVDNENPSPPPNTQAVRHFAEFLQRELAVTIIRELKEPVCLDPRHALISDQLRHLISRCLVDTTQLYLDTRKEIISSSPRCRSTLGLVESPSPISHAESPPPATTDTRLNDCNIDSGYVSTGNNDLSHRSDSDFCSILRSPPSSWSFWQCDPDLLDLSKNMTEADIVDFWDK